MPYAQVSYQLGEYEALTVDVGTEATSPDACTDIVNRARSLFRDALTDLYDDSVTGPADTTGT